MITKGFYIAIFFMVGILLGAMLVMPKTEGFMKTSILVPAVSGDGKGISTSLTVEALPGSGRTLTNIDKLVFWTDTQQSIQSAKKIAEETLNRSFNNVDLLYTVDTNNMTIVGGPSAGASLAIATIAAMSNRTLNNSVMMTGTIEPNGTIGAVGGIEEKAEAAKKAGKTLFLIPAGEGVYTKTVPIQNCHKDGELSVCEITYEKKEIRVNESVGIDVLEVSNISEAIKYFILSS